MTVWKSDVDIVQLNNDIQGNMAGFLGVEFIEVGDDFLCAHMPVNHKTHQSIGLLHGGASCVLAETVGSRAANYCVDNTTHYCVGLDINANHICSIKSGLVIAKATPIHLGGKTQVWQIMITNEDNRLICISRLTLAVLLR